MTLETNVEGIGHLLSDRLLAIPDYQRSYSWERDEIDELWTDLEHAIAQDVSEYFLGSVVTTQVAEGERHQVIDGQQRLASVSLMYASLRDIFSSRSDVRAQEIEHELLGKPDILTRVQEPRLVLNADDNNVFRELTLAKAQDRNLNPTLESHRRLVAAFDFFHGKFVALIGDRGPDDWQAPLLSWYAFVYDKARVIEVSVADEARAFVIFETLNDRGLDLSTSDLLKNHLFGTAGDRLEEAKSRWQRAMAAFAPRDTELDADVFLRHYWASEKGVVRVKALYTQMKPTISDPDTAVAFADELAHASPLWASMYDRDSDQWKGYNAGALTALDTLRNLKVEQCRPLLLAALRNLTKEEISKLLTLVVAWSIRWFVAGGGGGGVVERLYAETALKVTKGELVSADNVAEAVAGQVPSDERFREAFKILTVRRGWLARYYLAVLERAQRGDPEPELVPNTDVEEVNLEHVLPQNPTGNEWPAFTPEEAQNMRLMLGNQALLRKSHNEKIGNQSFTAKKPILAASDLVLTRQIGQQPDWTPQAIRDRQEQLANLAVTVWKRR
jgi:hypothetical protein